MKTAVFLQARMGSTRLPGKAMLKLGPLTLLEWCLRALDKVGSDVHAVLTDAASQTVFEIYTKRAGWELFVGDPENVLDRFVKAAGHFGAQYLLRATADNPFVSAHLAQLNLNALQEGGWDLFAYQMAPLGTGTEAVRTDALLFAIESDPDAYEREHVTPFIYRNPERFRIGRPTVGPSFYHPEGRVTVDTQEDYERLKTLVERNSWEPPLDLASLVRTLHG